jgi:GT2 family glycosyltransferase
MNMSVNLIRRKVYIVILNWNGWHDTIECLESVFKSIYPAFRVIVCDNHSEDNSIEYIREWAEGRLTLDVTERNQLKHLLLPPVPKPIRYLMRDESEINGSNDSNDDGTRLMIIKNRDNYGFAGGNNVGLRYALARNDFDYIWLLNNDTVVAPDALSHLVERMTGAQNIGICGSTLRFYHNPDLIQALGGANYHQWLGVATKIGAGQRSPVAIDQKTAESKMDYVVGASMFVTKPFLTDIGILNEDYFLYYEELDWAIRAKGRYTLGYAAKSIVFHKEGASIGSNRTLKQRSLTGDYYLIRNKIFFTQKFYPYALPTVYGVILVAIMNRIKDRMWQNAWVMFKVLLAPWRSYAKVVKKSDSQFADNR